MSNLKDKVTPKYLLYALVAVVLVVAYAVIGQLVLEIDRDTLMNGAVIISITLSAICIVKGKRE